MSGQGLVDRARAAARKPVDRLNRPRVRRARHGFARGFKVVGGIGLVLPRALRGRAEYPEFEGLEEAFLRGLDLEGKTVYDVGAFQGFLTLFFAGRVGPGGTVCAFEPHPDNFERIQQHLDLNGLTNAMLRNVAIGSEEGELQMASVGGGSGQATADEGIVAALTSAGTELETVTVPVRTLDQQLSEGLPPPDFVKIDVEGLEIDVLEGMQRILEQHGPELFVEIHGADAEAKLENATGVVELLHARGYAMRHVESERPVEPDTAEVAMRGHIHGVPGASAS